MPRRRYEEESSVPRARARGARGEDGPHSLREGLDGIGEEEQLTLLLARSAREFAGDQDLLCREHSDEPHKPLGA